MQGFWDLIGRVLFSKHRDLFAATLGTNVLLIKLGILPGSVLGKLLGFVFRGVIGVFIDEGVLVIDITLDSLREGAKTPEFKEEAKKAYDYATAKIYDEAEKEKIRKRYLDILSKVVPVGDGPK